MKAIFSMWSNTRMIILTAVCAAVYAAALNAFKTALPLIPGITEVRVGNIFPVPVGLLFGPAGAWGAAIGNVIGDMLGGTLGPGSLGGFFGNFLAAYLPYSLWTTWVPFRLKSREWKAGNARCWLLYFLVAFISGGACAVVIAAVVDAFGIVPYSILTKIIVVNNVVAGWIGVTLLTTVFGFVRNTLHLFWPEVLEEEASEKPLLGTVGAWLVVLATLFGLVGQYVLPLEPSRWGWLASLLILGGSLLL
ncbi:MAG: QueT transporter family protein [Desulfobacterota bacterium]|nr:QueT transporter family protein [Thermodesulfobacteriota bacterium]